MFPSVSSDFTGPISDNRHYSTDAIEEALLLCETNGAAQLALVNTSLWEKTAGRTPSAVLALIRNRESRFINIASFLLGETV